MAASSMARSIIFFAVRLPIEPGRPTVQLRRGWLYVWVGHQNDIAVFQLLNETRETINAVR